MEAAKIQNHKYLENKNFFFINYFLKLFKITKFQTLETSFSQKFFSWFLITI